MYKCFDRFIEQIEIIVYATRERYYFVVVYWRLCTGDSVSKRFTVNLKFSF